MLTNKSIPKSNKRPLRRKGAPIPCPNSNCGLLLANKWSLRKHIKRKHDLDSQSDDSSSLPIPCPNGNCEMKLANKWSLQKHIKRKHNPDRVYKYNCDMCVKGFHQASHLIRHKVEHTGVHPFTCENCNLGFISKGLLNRHYRTHTTYVCKCGESFERYFHMLAHKRLCQIPTCELCGKTFKKPYVLKLHMQIHQSPSTKQPLSRKYTCYNCDRKYFHKRNLASHIHKIHQNVISPPKMCTYPGCLRAFSRNQTLNHHIKVVHSGMVIIRKVRKTRRDKGLPKTKNSSNVELKTLQSGNVLNLNEWILKQEELNIKEEYCVSSLGNNQNYKLEFFPVEIKQEPG